MTSGTTHRIPGTLPPQATGFVGRQVEVAQVSVALMESRLVTIVGTGGVGKTRVAVRVAAQTTGRYPDGVRLVELSAVRDPELLASTVAASLGLPAADARPQLAAVLDYLRARALLLILDTCEHLVDACAALAAEVLREAPGVTLLVTSRQPLGVRAECVFQLRPLPVPEVDDEASDSGAAARPDGRPPRRPFSRAHRRQAGRAGAPSDAPRRDRVEPRPLHGDRAGGVGQAVRLRRPVRPRRGGGGMRERRAERCARR